MSNAHNKGIDRMLHQTTADPINSPAKARVFRIAASKYRAIQASIGAYAPETGGMLGGSRETGIIEDFHFDVGAGNTSATYSPNTTALNRLLSEIWNPSEIHLLGFVHSHPAGCRQPSGGDLIYAQRILAHNEEMDCLWLPIIIPAQNGRPAELLPFVALRAEDGKGVVIESAVLEVVEAQGLRAGPVLPAKALESDEAFSRVRNAYDLARLVRCRLIIVGCGGAVEWIEAFARTGLGQIFVMDDDKVSLTNIGTQQTYRSDIGRLKVDCIKERILDINPNAQVVAVPRNLDDTFSDADFAALLDRPGLDGLAPVQTLLCGFTDNFYAQARVNRLALQFGIPSLCAQLHAEGRTMELTFTYPGITPSCHRCALSSRYRAYLEQGYRNQVGSHGTPIFATSRLNALKGFVAMALLHHGMAKGDPGWARWGGLLERIGGRSSAFIRLDPDAELTVFDRVFDGADRRSLLFDETVWRAPTPDDGKDGNPRCPECGGMGDLRLAKGTIEDTRVMKPYAD